MNAAAAILDYVGRAGKIDRDALIAEIEREHDPKVVSPTVSTLLRRGELQELPDGHIALADDDAIEKARAEREERRAGRNPAAGTPPVAAAPVAAAPVATARAKPAPVATVPVKPRPGSSSTALRNCTAIRNALEQHGAMRAIDLLKRVDIHGGESNLYYHANQMFKRGELLKQDGFYAVRPEQFWHAKTEAAPAAEAPESVPPQLQPDQQRAVYGPNEPSKLADEALLAEILAPVARIQSIAEIARRHAATTPEEHVLQLGDIYIAVTAPAAVATRVLSAALAVLGEPA